MIEFLINGSKLVEKVILSRDWRKYLGDRLNKELSQVDWGVKFEDAQSCWNNIELNLIKIVDKIAPLKEFSGNMAAEKPNWVVKNKILLIFL